TAIIRSGGDWGVRIVARLGGLHDTCSKAVILPRTIVNRTAKSAPGVSHVEVSRSPRRNAAVAYRPRTLSDTSLPEHRSCACSWTPSARVRHVPPYGPSIRLISAGSLNSRASAALLPAFRFASQARTTAFIRSACDGCGGAAWGGFAPSP